MKHEYKNPTNMSISSIVYNKTLSDLVWWHLDLLPWKFALNIFKVPQTNTIKSLYVEQKQSKF